jgi:hypothetical protein
MKPDIVIRITLLTLAAMVPGSAFADWKIQFDSVAAESLHMKYNDTLRGSFATRAEAEAYQRSRPLFEQHHSSIVGFDTAPPPARMPPGVPVIAGDNKNQTNQLKSSLNRSLVDAAVLKQLNGNFNQTVAGRENGFEKDKNELFSVHSSTAPPVSFYGAKTTRGLVFTPPKTRPLGPLAGLTDEELARRYTNNAAEIQSLMLAAKRTIENNDRQQKARAGTEADIAVASNNWQAAKKEAMLSGGAAAVGEGLSVAGQSVKNATAKTVLENTAKGVDYADKTKSLAGDAREVWDSVPHGPAETLRAQASDTFDVGNEHSTYKSGGLASPEPYRLTVDPNFKNSVTLNEFSNVNFTATGQPASPAAKKGPGDLEWKQAAASVRNPQPQLTMGPAAPPTDNGESFDSKKAAIAAADAFVTLRASPGAGLAYTAGKYGIEAADAFERHNLYGGAVDQYNEDAQFNLDYANFRSQRIKELEQDQQNIRAEQARRAALRKE